MCGLREHVIQPTDQLCPSHSCGTDMYPCRHYYTMPRYVRGGDSCETENADDGKTNGRGDTCAMNCVRGLERERDQQTSSYLYLHIVVAVLLSTSCFLSPVALHKPFFILFYINHNTCTPHSGQDLQTCNAYGSSYMYTVDPTLSLSQQQQTNKQKQLMLKTKQDELN